MEASPATPRTLYGGECALTFDYSKANSYIDVRRWSAVCVVPTPLASIVVADSREGATEHNDAASVVLFCCVRCDPKAFRSFVAPDTQLETWKYGVSGRCATFELTTEQLARLTPSLSLSDVAQLIVDGNQKRAADGAIIPAIPPRIFSRLILHDLGPSLHIVIEKVHRLCALGAHARSVSTEFLEHAHEIYPERFPAPLLCESRIAVLSKRVRTEAVLSKPAGVAAVYLLHLRRVLDDVRARLSQV